MFFRWKPSTLSQKALVLKLQQYDWNWKDVNDAFRQTAYYSRGRDGVRLDSFPEILDRFSGLDRKLLRTIKNIEHSKEYGAALIVERASHRPIVKKVMRDERFLMVDYAFRLATAAYTNSCAQFGSHGCLDGA